MINSRSVSAKPDAPASKLNVEESLRHWAGAALVNEPLPSPLPQASPRETRDFLRRHGIQAITRDAAVRHAYLPMSGELLDLLHNDYLQLAAEELVRAREFVRVMREVALRTRPGPIVLKGTALAYQVYDLPHLRPRGDVDVLTGSGGLERIMTGVLEKQGYHRSPVMNEPLVVAQTSFQKCDDAFHIAHTWDVHRKLSNRPRFAHVLTYERLLETAAEVPLAGIPVLAPAPADSLLIACLHLTGHHGHDVRLVWLYDIHLLVASLPDSDREAFIRDATGQPEVWSACRDALFLTQYYLPADATAGLLRAIDPAGTATVGDRRSYLARLANDATALSGVDRFRFVRQHLFPSGDYMMQRFGLQRRWQVPVWYLVRIARAIPKLFRKR